MQMPAMPAASNASTVRIALIALPKPVSQSATTGIDTASLMRRPASSVSVIVRMLASGTAWLALISKPLAHTPSKPASCTRRPLRPSCAPARRIGPGAARRRRSAALLVIDIGMDATISQASIAPERTARRVLVVDRAIEIARVDRAGDEAIAGRQPERALIVAGQH